MYFCGTQAENIALDQRFSTWGTCTPGGHRAVTGGAQRHTILALFLIWGYASTKRWKNSPLDQPFAFWVPLNEQKNVGVPPKM